MAREPRVNIVRRQVFPEVEVVNCHAVRSDEQLLAICPNTEDILIFQLVGDEFQRTNVLLKHTQRVTGLAWSCFGRLASCAEDRTAYVWEREADAGDWRSVLVELRAPRAALCLAWAPNGMRIAVGLASKDLGICYYEAQAKCWVALKVGKSKAAVGAVAWHPTSQYIATGSTDRRCMVYDVHESLMGQSGFGEMQVNEDAGSWVNAVAFSPKGQFLAFCGQDATARVKDLTAGPSAPVTTLRWRGLPFLQAIFTSERCLIACGFDCAPVLFRRSDTQWEVYGRLNTGPVVGAPLTERAPTAFSEARNHFRGSTPGSGGGVASGTGGTSPQAGTAASSAWHTNTITACSLLSSSTGRFSTSALDGQVLVCELSM
uniref:Arp2/3 complex 41 kDa subunit n=1 Tax=Pyrodinium bahamense TaxID=73915 RepID=A0A7S0AF93_9DINO|mmetsp:Transcript_33193/g.91810  ORF Transcript_33193/g.91810 Transcript_33193/m.91810 type:complete len:374 (+) Transcript_33193:173-1294(+)|eukprot:CAMPEP_0179096148 /NCGR_PEP_ID=MMETSP0796-20121207/44182_1 /TAXON_ID=73915 /ORGANISM="Pyrodinium bahamense, Strain pbaha01" /LENGTH=373 /DNA_ID=CAMNT_0020793853 /DNA_START=118 /DNA_END=1239 /DNA_ORIENTATION=-